MWCVLVAEIVDKPLAVSAFPSNGIYLAGHPDGGRLRKTVTRKNLPVEDRPPYQKRENAALRINLFSTLLCPPPRGDCGRPATLTPDILCVLQVI